MELLEEIDADASASVSICDDTGLSDAQKVSQIRVKLLHIRALIAAQEPPGVTAAPATEDDGA